MFPNVRLMVAAIAASIVMLSCGFGVFAAFRVNHEPFGRLPSAAPLQLAADSAATSALPAAGAPAFDARFAIADAKIAGGTAGASDATAPENLPAVPTPEVTEQEMPQPVLVEDTASAASDKPAAAMAAAPDANNTAADQALPAQPSRQAALDVDVEPQAATAAAKADNKDEADKPNGADSADTAKAEKAEKSEKPGEGIAVRAARAREARLAAAHKTARQHVAAAAAPHRVRKVRVRTVVQPTLQTQTFAQQGLDSTLAATPQTRVVRVRRTARAGGVGGPFVRPPAQ